MAIHSPDKQQRYFDVIAGRRGGAAATIARGLLHVASWGYGAASWLRNRTYDAGWGRVERVDVPVVSVGNLTLGGTGKTPCVEYVARYLSDRGRRVAILSRGYGAGGGANDESLMLDENLPDVPHLQGSDRVELARLAMEELESEVLLLDDGFQHRRLARDLDLVLIDATQPWGLGYLTPRGLLRESPRELRRANAVIITHCDLVSREIVAAIRMRIAVLAPGVPVIESVHRSVALAADGGARQTLDIVQGKPVAAFCGIGNPDTFRATLLGLRLDLRVWRTFPDHYDYTRKNVENLATWAEKLPADGLVLTTQKDLVKLRLARLGDRPLWALKIELAFREGEEKLRELLDRVVGKHG